MLSRNLLYFLFALSGFSGLIYESVWSHYLKLFLGSAAYAQSMVLMLFMGGMALGAWFVGSRIKSVRSPLQLYAWVEVIIGLSGLFFHLIFGFATKFAYESMFPALNDSNMIMVVKFLLASLLILPQSILLGTTFPLMATGIMRIAGKNPGKTISTLYFSNCIGAVLGVLLSGFWLIEVVGLPGTLSTAGAINLSLAAVVLLLLKGLPISKITIGTKPRNSVPLNSSQISLYLFAALITGTASFIYEISWIRLLSQVLGSSTHAFELMLAAFILGLAIGGLWIRKRIDKYREPLKILALVQIIMGMLALATIPVYDSTIDAMKWTMSILNRSESSYTLFNIASHLFAGIVMIPVTFLAGMTLPLVTFCLYRSGVGEKSIGTVYAYNTLGAILGVLLAVHFLLPMVGVRIGLIVGAAMDLSLGLYLLLRYIPLRQRVYVTALSTLTLFLAGMLLTLDPLRLASGVYRYGHLLGSNENELLFAKDGKTASVTLIQHQKGIVSVRTNGKPDASLRMTDTEYPTDDESTMVLAAALPLSMHPYPRQIGNIGMGSGLTTHAILYSDKIERIDTIEIEPAMVEAARGFGKRVGRAYEDPRSRIHYDDAKTYFSSVQPRYDILIAEPSNPWVSGVSSLFTHEFYKTVTRHLNVNGLFVQWLQLYETQMPIVASVMKAIKTSFPHYKIFMTNSSDMLIVASLQELPEVGESDIFVYQGMKEELNRLGIHSNTDLQFRMVASELTLEPFFGSYTIRANSDYYPVLDIYAPKARFMASTATELAYLPTSPIPAIEMLDEKWIKPDTARKLNNTHSEQRVTVPRVNFNRTAIDIRDYLIHDRLMSYSSHFVPVPGIARDAALVKSLSAGCQMQAQWLQWKDASRNIASVLIPALRPTELSQVWTAIGFHRCRNHLEPHQREWHDLLMAVGERSSMKMITTAKAVLQSTQVDWADTDRRYAAFAIVVGNLAVGNNLDAIHFLNLHKVILDNSDSVQDKITARYLRALAKVELRL